MKSSKDLRSLLMTEIKRYFFLLRFLRNHFSTSLFLKSMKPYSVFSRMMLDLIHLYFQVISCSGFDFYRILHSDAAYFTLLVNAQNVKFINKNSLFGPHKGSFFSESEILFILFQISQKNYSNKIS